jgi:hypothetical protein
MENKEKYQVSSSVKDGIIEMVVTGELTKNSVEKMLNEIIAIQKSMNLEKRLVDVRKLKGRPTDLEIYYFIIKRISVRPTLKIAFVDLPVNAKTASFHESSALDAGLSYKWFTGIRAARAWLKSE